MSCQFSTYLALSGIICFVHLCSGQQRLLSFPSSLSTDIHGSGSISTSKTKIGFGFCMSFGCSATVGYSSLINKKEQLLKYFCTGQNKWGTWIYSDIRLVWQPLVFWYQFALDIFLLWRPFALTFFCFDILLLWHPTVLRFRSTEGWRIVRRIVLDLCCSIIVDPWACYDCYAYHCTYGCQMFPYFLCSLCGMRIPKNHSIFRGPN